MNNSYTAEDLLKIAGFPIINSREQHLAASRELHLANENLNPTKPQYVVVDEDKNHKCPREVYKEVKTERENYISRLSEENEILVESLRDSSLPGQSPSMTLATPVVTSSDLLSEDSKRVSELPAARTISREKKYSGISVQHNITKKGIKVSINLQTPEDAEQNTMLSITAELKSSERLREIKEYTFDTDEFRLYVKGALDTINQLPHEQRHQIAAGRAHARGKRSSWFQNVFVVGILNNHRQLEQLTLKLDHEEYEIRLDRELSSSQQQLYHSSGIYGELRLVPMAPTLDQAERIRLNKF